MLVDIIIFVAGYLTGHFAYTIVNAKVLAAWAWIQSKLHPAKS